MSSVGDSDAGAFENAAFVNRQFFEAHFVELGEDFIHASLVVLFAASGRIVEAGDFPFRLADGGSQFVVVNPRLAIRLEEFVARYLPVLGSSRADAGRGGLA